MTREVERFFSCIGVEINKEKSATNDRGCEETATLLEGKGVYKYLGIIEDSSGTPKRDTFEAIKRKLLLRVDKLCSRKLNAKNLFKAINEHAISLVNYHI